MADKSLVARLCEQSRLFSSGEITAPTFRLRLVAELTQASEEDLCEVSAALIAHELGKEQ
jgi:hypothetical protein